MKSADPNFPTRTHLFLTVPSTFPYFINMLIIAPKPNVCTRQIQFKSAYYQNNSRRNSYFFFEWVPKNSEASAADGRRNEPWWRKLALARRSVPFQAKHELKLGELGVPRRTGRIDNIMQSRSQEGHALESIHAFNDALYFNGDAENQKWIVGWRTMSESGEGSLFDYGAPLKKWLRTKSKL